MFFSSRFLIKMNSTKAMSEMESTNANVKTANVYKNVKMYSDNILGQIMQINNHLSKNMENRSWLLNG